jgi:Icc protein
MQHLCIAQITDLHITTSDGVGNFERFNQVLKNIKEDSTINSIVISGDIAEGIEDRNIYERVKSLLDATELSYHVMPGNHDNAALLSEVFGLQDWFIHDRLYYTEEFDFGKILFFDTSTGELSMEQLIWLEEECSSSYQKFLLFLHHPPVLGGIPYLDNNFALSNLLEVQKVLKKNNNIQGIFCGHYHVERSIRLGNHIVFITPSNAFQVVENGDEITKINTAPVYRKIYWDGSTMRTHIVWC